MKSTSFAIVIFALFFLACQPINNKDVKGIVTNKILAGKWTYLTSNYSVKSTNTYITGAISSIMKETVIDQIRELKNSSLTFNKDGSYIETLDSAGVKILTKGMYTIHDNCLGTDKSSYQIMYNHNSQKGIDTLTIIEDDIYYYKFKFKTKNDISKAICYEIYIRSARSNC